MNRPLCKCHGEPMQLHGKQKGGRTKFHCSVKKKIDSIKRRGDNGTWMEVLRVTKVSEVTDGA